MTNEEIRQATPVTGSSMGSAADPFETPVISLPGMDNYSAIIINGVRYLREVPHAVTDSQLRNVLQRAVNNPDTLLALMSCSHAIRARVEDMLK